ncbi:uncharacterized protein AMSG_06967 [Thecamonas trahens ATCC 50062]|uniref:Uncharacterized protein n=1 Tax=Thecamonas trahens ATCC 50062 TaxID=461836 RepID=A0A0L0DFD1_THETB|nr:hypothetical protein AMSG_06967 [Thecamonas trahens ATCC 50062]KNC50994.1 hypothetical protein AMSG_06967 [Thecamonas trahens ATCC 50062]|eukprot:XP_013756463.1 hypothetical protein AMSG_06967 [Thecamonas trahens ATCC 50062]
MPCTLLPVAAQAPPLNCANGGMWATSSGALSRPRSRSRRRSRPRSQRRSRTVADVGYDGGAIVGVLDTASEVEVVPLGGDVRWQMDIVWRRAARRTTGASKSVVIQGAIGPQYAPTALDVGSYLEAVVTPRWESDGSQAAAPLVLRSLGRVTVEPVMGRTVDKLVARGHAEFRLYSPVHAEVVLRLDRAKMDVLAVPHTTRDRPTTRRELCAARLARAELNSHMAVAYVGDVDMELAVDASTHLPLVAKNRFQRDLLVLTLGALRAANSVPSSSSSSSGSESMADGSLSDSYEQLVGPSQTWATLLSVSMSSTSDDESSSSSSSSSSSWTSSSGSPQDDSASSYSFFSSSTR